jgi:hypothetical protein
MGNALQSSSPNKYLTVGVNMQELENKSKGLESLASVLDDILREQRISHYKKLMLKAVSTSWKRFYWKKMRSEIMSRSPSQVVRMEAERGLSQ